MRRLPVRTWELNTQLHKENENLFLPNIGILLLFKQIPNMPVLSKILNC